MYGSEVWETFLDWDSNKWDEGAVEKAYTQFLKQVLGVNRSTTTSFVRAEIGRHSLQEEILRRNIKYARYLHDKEESAYVKQAYDYEVSRDNRSKSFLNTMNRHADIYEISGSFKPYANPFENLYRLGDDNLKLVTRRLFHNIWSKQIQSSPKADTFRLFKFSVQFEPYLLHKYRKERVSLTKLRLSDHKLMIEEARHYRPKPPREERKCYMCHQETESEVHFMTECKIYGTHTHYWNKIFDKCPNLRNLSNQDRFIYLMIQEDVDITNIVLKMTSEWFSLRRLLCDYFFQPKA